MRARRGSSDLAEKSPLFSFLPDKQCPGIYFSCLLVYKRFRYIFRDVLPIDDRRLSCALTHP